VAELSRDPVDDAFHEIQLSGKQLVFLFMATTVISVVIFLCGVVVGRGVRAEDIGVDPSVAAASAPAPAVPAPSAEALTADPPTPPSEAPLSYQQRLESEKAPAEDLKTKPEPRRSEPEAARTAGAADRQPLIPPATQGARPGTWAIQVQALRDRDVAGQVVQRLRSKGYPAFLVAPTAGAPTQLFRVQVGRYSERGEAQQVEMRLKKEEQFDTFIVR
jgi:cell division septation protein DedD